ncbi:hypothetical protein GGI24_006076, partial [Coemansia furcata]
RSTHNGPPTDIEQAARNLQTRSAPGSQLPTAIAALRQRAQSSPWVQQLISGPRVCKFSGLHLPRDMHVRVKPKANPHTEKPMLSVDELERYSSALGLSQYLPLSARGLYAAITDQTNARVVGEMGLIRPDIVEHTARVLRLRSVAAMHRAHLEFVSHQVSMPPPKPKNGASRLDAIRVEVSSRVRSQDAMWPGPSVYVPLPSPLKKAGQLSWQLSDVLPAAGLQCIIELPAGPLDMALSVSSEACARTVWNALTSHPAHDRAVDRQVNILTQFATWKAFVMPGKPEPHEEPTLSMEALETLYHCLPRLTPERLAINTEVSRSKKRRAKKISPAQTSPETDQVTEIISRAEAVISHPYSLYRPGHSADGSATKLVPVYNAKDIFGLAAASTVIPWLLHVPMNDVSEPHAELSVRYVGVVALPCTAELATQLHRVVTYASNV